MEDRLWVSDYYDSSHSYYSRNVDMVEEIREDYST